MCEPKNDDTSEPTGASAPHPAKDSPAQRSREHSPATLQRRSDEAGALARFHRAPHLPGRGRLGEDYARTFLEQLGLEILAANVETALGEIDLIARDDETLCFVEVKARASRRRGEAVEAVHRHKRGRIIRAAQVWVQSHPWTGPIRFDVVTMDFVRPGEAPLQASLEAGDDPSTTPGEWHIRHWPNAFEAPPGTA